MSRQFSGTDNLTVASAIVTAYPFTLAGWFRSTDLTVDQAIIGVFNTASPGDLCVIGASGAQAGDPVQAVSADNVGSGTASTSTGYSSGVWHHACGVFASATDRRAFIDGGSKGTNATSKTPSGLNRTRVGRNGDSTPDATMVGRVAEAAIWNVALSDAEVAALGKGASPLRVRPSALLAYWPIYGTWTTERSVVRGAGKGLTVSGTTQAAHSPKPGPVFVGPGSWPGAFTAAGGGGGGGANSDRLLLLGVG